MTITTGDRLVEARAAIARASRAGDQAAEHQARTELAKAYVEYHQTEAASWQREAERLEGLTLGPETE